MRHGVGIVERLLCLLFPSRCLLCDKITAAGAAFCDDCVDLCPSVPIVRNLTSGNREFTVLSALPYRDGFRETLHSYKFQGERACAAPIGRLMAEFLSKADGFDCVTWVAMSKKKKRLRGYDQSELLARSVARTLGLPCLRLIEKVRETDTQHELPREQRITNIKNAYRADASAAGRSVILIDDIVTTGSTICECAEALYRAGAKEVLGLCAADTPFTKQEEAEE